MKTILLAAALAGGLVYAESPSQSPRRIVTLGGAVTEIVFALGAGDRVVAVDLSSVYPPEAEALPQVGYHRALSSEGVLSLRPDLILGTEEAGPPAALKQLRATKIPLKLLPVEHSAEGVREKILTIAKILNREEGGRKLVDALDGDLETARARIAASGQPPRVLFIYARGQGTLSVSGRNTAADAMIALTGATNAVTGYQGYKPLTPEALAAAAPDVLLLTTTGLESIGGRDGLLTQPGIALTPAGKSGKIIALDDDLMLSFGPRLGKGALALARLLYPDTAKADE